MLLWWNGGWVGWGEALMVFQDFVIRVETSETRPKEYPLRLGARCSRVRLGGLEQLYTLKETEV